MKDKLKNFKHLFFKILKFEIFYKFAIFLIISPLINKILQIYLNNNSSGAAFNQYILFNFLNLEGITVVLIIMMMAVIAPEDAPYIFDRGFIGHNLRDGDYRSTGMGLYFVKEIAEKLGIKVIYDNTFCSGSRFKLQFEDNAEYFMLDY